MSDEEKPIGKTLRELGLEVPGLKAQGQAVKSLQYPIGVEREGETPPGVVTVLLSQGAGKAARPERYVLLSKLSAAVQELVMLQMVTSEDACSGIAGQVVMVSMSSAEERAPVRAAAEGRIKRLLGVRSLFAPQPGFYATLHNRIEDEVRALRKLIRACDAPVVEEPVKSQEEIDAEAEGVVQGLINKARATKVSPPGEGAPEEPEE